MKTIARNESGRGVNKPGRNAKGQWLNDDDTGVQALETILDGIDALFAWMQEPSMDATKREQIAIMHRGLILTAKEAVRMIDVGTKPKGEN